MPKSSTTGATPSSAHKMAADSSVAQPTTQTAATVDAYFAAMRQGSEGQEALLALFHDEATYTEPFGGVTRTHRGKRDIEAMFQASMQQRPPDLVLNVHQIDVDGRHANAQWSCESPAFPAAIFGRDVYEIEGGLIVSLTTEFLPSSEAG